MHHVLLSKLDTTEYHLFQSFELLSEEPRSHGILTGSPDYNGVTRFELLARTWEDVDVAPQLVEDVLPPHVMKVEAPYYKERMRLVQSDDIEMREANNDEQTRAFPDAIDVAHDEVVGMLSNANAPSSSVDTPPSGADANQRVDDGRLTPLNIYTDEWMELLMLHCAEDAQPTF